MNTTHTSNTDNNNTTETHTMNKHITTGTNGSGNTVWLVVTTDNTQAWTHVERFDNEAEALNWLNWS